MLSVLKVIGFILLFILLILLLTACILLFCPVSYKLGAKDVNVRFAVKWLFGVVKLKLEYIENNLSFNLLIFGKNRKTGEEKKQAEKEQARKKTQKANDREKKINAAEERIEKSGKKEKNDKNTANDANETPQNENRLKKIIDTFKSFYNYPDRKILVKKTLLLIKRLLRPIKPSKFYVNGVVGFNSPDITGKFLAVESLLVCFTGLPINIKGDFNRKHLNLNLSASGRFCFFSLVWPFAFYIFSKPVWKVVNKYLKNKEENNE